MSVLDFLQAASNSAAGGVSAPVDAIAWLLRKAGAPVPANPVGGSDWMEQRGLTRPVQQSGASLAGETVGLLSPMVAAAKAPQIARGLLQAGDNLAAPRTLDPQTGAIVWHGSPHKFDAFDSSKIGTGEGAQAYGHGLYLAESPDVAGSYAAMNQASAPSRATFIRLRDKAPAGSAEWKHYDALANEGIGSLYKVDLPDEKIARMLDWDKPLSQQPKAVRDVLAKFDPDTYHPSGGDYDANEMGQQIYNRLAGVLNVRNPSPVSGMAQATGYLKQQGIPGIRYLDGGSRGAGSGSSNFVVFPGEESALSILERNGQRLK